MSFITDFNMSFKYASTMLNFCSESLNFPCHKKILHNFYLTFLYDKKRLLRNETCVWESRTLLNSDKVAKYIYEGSRWSAINVSNHETHENKDLCLLKERLI